MSSPVPGVEERQPLTEAADLMDKHRTLHLGVTKEGHSLGWCPCGTFSVPSPSTTSSRSLFPGPLPSSLVHTLLLFRVADPASATVRAIPQRPLWVAFSPTHVHNQLQIHHLLSEAVCEWFVLRHIERRLSVFLPSRHMQNVKLS